MYISTSHTMLQYLTYLYSSRILAQFLFTPSICQFLFVYILLFMHFIFVVTMFLKTFSPSILYYSFLYTSIQLSAASVFNKLDLTIPVCRWTEEHNTVHHNTFKACFQVNRWFNLDLQGNIH